MEILANPPEPALAADDPFNIEYSGFVTEDDTPADSEFSEKQMRLLTRALHASWKPGVPFTVTANVGLYFHLNSSPLVPDVMLALGVGSPEDPMPREHRACFVWNRGQIPDIVIEIVLNREGDELTRKFERYASHNVPYYVVYDPETFIQAKALRCFELDLHRFPKTYREMEVPFFPTVQLGLQQWDGAWEERKWSWVRWTDAEGRLIPTGKEAAKVADEGMQDAKENEREAMVNARVAMERAQAALEQVAVAEQRAEKMAAKLRALGLDPEG